ncbi:thioredoxin-like domain-containing protein [Luteolibacter marinus]|uniref:thioredoxin-like domain-containing protein n=1 Tax=Luteolibacter marinus TaxID=2776705 RepID=UPI001868F7E5|nr:thioredoxin-like domain-containing protein [Luteolibacter marinus]
MKTTILLSLLLAGVSFAGFEKWTNKDGKTAELDLIKVVEKDGEKAGEFKMRNGKTVTLKASDLSEEAGEKLAAWEPPAAEVQGKPSVFDDTLDGNLLKLDGKRLKKFELTERPEKFYVFYYTASWCGPCQQFTPSLVEFYNEHKNENFEIVLITSDQDEDSMEEYAANKSMPWPQLKLKKANDFKKEFKHGVTGIPSVIVCDLEGKNLGNFRNLAELEKLVK